MFNNAFAAKKRVFVQNVKGRFRRLKWLLNFVFLTIYFCSPFLRFDRGSHTPNQAILIDFKNSKAYFFMIEIWPQEVYYLAGILIIAAIILFFITSLFGRIWCGYACFQTVWTDIFIAFERLFQGDRNSRILLDRKNNFEKFYKKSLTHLSWIIFSIATGYGFVCYFNDSITLSQNISKGQISFNVLGWILGIATMTYIMAGFAREHVCTYMCPYSRFQSAMFDNNTLIITYDSKRGEPRGKMTKNQDFENQGHCIDCKQCQVVCPTGIDIRDGLQMECIACGLCIDACDNIMEKVGLPKGLIRYDTLNHLANPIKKNKFKILKPRTIFYSTILTIVCAIMLKSLITKSLLELSIIPNRNPLFVKLSNGSIRNSYIVKVMNKSHQTQSFRLDNTNVKDLILTSNSNQINNIEVKPNSIKSFKIYGTIPNKIINKINTDRLLVNFTITNNKTNYSKDSEAIFIIR